VAGAVSCNAIELNTPSTYWRPSAPWRGDRSGSSGGRSEGGSGTGVGGSGTGVSEQTPAPPNTGYYPADLLSAYNLAKPASSMAPGSSAPTVAIVDAYDDPNAAADLAAYRASMSGSTDPNTGLSDSTIPPLCSPTITSGCVTFTKLSQTGGTKYPAGNSGWAEEISLDLDMVSAICPDCNILLVEASSSSIANLATAEQEAESFHPVAIDNSYGGSEFNGETSYNSIYSSIAASSSNLGMAITAATGDDGYGTLFPAVSPLVTAVGGTSLSYTGTGSSLVWSAQTVWSDAGSGCSSYEATPTWQEDQGVYRLSSDCSGREVADVSADADPETGVATYDSYGESGWLVFGGTSVSTQIIGATYGLAAGTGSFKPSPQTLYPDSGATTGPTPGLVPVSSGDNTTSCGDYLCIAGDSLSSGYNGPTGLGTPDGLTAFSSATTPPPPPSGSLSFSPTSEDLTAGVASGAITIDLSTPAPSAGLTVALSTSSSGGGFSNSPAGPFTQTLVLPTISSDISSSGSFYYEDTVAGGPTITASASGWGPATLPTTVSAGPLHAIKVSPSPVTLAEGGTQLFTASGVDGFGNSVTISPSWSTTVPGGSMSPGSGTSATLQTTTSGNGSVTATQGSVSGSATVTVTAQATLSVTVKAGALSGSRARYEVPLTVTADNATSNAAVNGASVTLEIFGNAACTGTATASGTGTTASSGQVTFNFTTRTAATWCASATVTATGYSQGAGHTSFST
jgi:hypothetical protein